MPTLRFPLRLREASILDSFGCGFYGPFWLPAATLLSLKAIKKACGSGGRELPVPMPTLPMSAAFGRSGQFDLETDFRVAESDTSGASGLEASLIKDRNFTLGSSRTWGTCPGMGLAGGIQDTRLYSGSGSGMTRPGKLKVL